MEIEIRVQTEPAESKVNLTLVDGNLPSEKYPKSSNCKRRGEARTSLNCP